MKSVTKEASKFIRQRRLNARDARQQRLGVLRQQQERMGALQQQRHNIHLQVRESVISRSSSFATAVCTLIILAGPLSFLRFGTLHEKEPLMICYKAAKGRATLPPGPEHVGNVVKGVVPSSLGVSQLPTRFLGGFLGLWSWFGGHDGRVTGVLLQCREGSNEGFRCTSVKFSILPQRKETDAQEFEIGTLTMYSDGLVPRRLPIRRVRVGTTGAVGERGRAGARARRGSVPVMCQSRRATEPP